MKTKTKFFLTLSTLVVIIPVIILWLVVAIINKEIELRNRVKAQQECCEAFFDKMWKVINQDAQVAEKYKNSFKEVYVPLIEGRYSYNGGGEFMKWIQEHNPQFDASLFKRIIDAIEAQREGFFIEQQKLVDVDREYKTFIQVFSNRLIVSDKIPIEIKIIKSLKTDTIYVSKKENDVNVF